jgi:4-amino-4-deoxy-L-arabinose transferase-like glycosyltransferase
MVKIRSELQVLLAIFILASFLRIYLLDKNPPSLFLDEVDAGYQAYSVLKTGKDYNGNFLPIHFQSFADYRTPLYIYSMVPTIAIFGLNEWGVRLPAAIFGILSVVALYYFARELALETKTSLAAAFLLAISPWHIHYSRAAFEVSLMLLFLILGFTFFLKGLKKNVNLFLAIFFLMLSFYTYSTTKLFLPLMGLMVLVLYFKEVKKLQIRLKIYLAIMAIVLIMPLGLDTIAGKAGFRFSYTSIFADPTIPQQIDRDRNVDDDTVEERTLGQSASVFSTITHNKLESHLHTFLNNYLSAFSSEFLFLKGDLNGRHSVGRMGQLYSIEVITLIVGLIALTKIKQKKTKIFLLGWLVLAPISSALTADGANHATRLILMLVPLIILSALGFVKIFESLNKQRSFARATLALFISFFALNIFSYLHQYYIHFPNEQSKMWHYGFKQVILKAQLIESSFDKIYLTPSVEPPLLFVLFWNKVDPIFYQTHRIEKVTLGNGEVIDKIGKYYFIKVDSAKVLSEKLYEDIDEKTLLISTFSDIPVDLRVKELPGFKKVEVIEYLNDDIGFYFMFRS